MWLSSSRSFKHISLNNQDKFCQNNLSNFLSSFPMNVLVSGRNFGKFIYHIQPETKTLIRKLQRILNKLYKQNFS